MKEKIRPYLLFLVVIIIDIAVYFLKPETGSLIFMNTKANFKQMLGVLPPIFILLGLMDVWVPRETMIRYMGEGSGIKGVFLSIFLGAAAAGPLYGAFPVAGLMMKKGAKFSNVITFLGAWSTLKIPMFLFETSALGARFSVTRWVVSLTGVILMAYIIDRLITSEEKSEIYLRHKEDFAGGMMNSIAKI
jgi:uncharacterized membrane protein YraQ (UPF0718 family)